MPIPWPISSACGWACASPTVSRVCRPHYYPDFIAVLTTGLTLLIEIKGRYADDADRKAKAAQRWVAAVNRCGEHGSWRYLVITEPPKLMLELDQLTGSTREAKGLVLG